MDYRGTSPTDANYKQAALGQNAANQGAANQGYQGYKDATQQPKTLPAASEIQHALQTLEQGLRVQEDLILLLEKALETVLRPAAPPLNSKADVATQPPATLLGQALASLTVVVHTTNERLDVLRERVGL